MNMANNDTYWILCGSFVAPSGLLGLSKASSTREKITCISIKYVHIFLKRVLFFKKCMCYVSRVNEAFFVKKMYIFFKTCIYAQKSGNC